MGYYDFKTNDTNSQPALYLGVYSSGAQINIKNIYAKYATLTADNFVVVPVNGSTSKSFSSSYPTSAYQVAMNGTVSAATSLSKTYNPSTGILTFSSILSASVSGYLIDQGYAANTSSNLNAKVYLLPKVESV